MESKPCPKSPSEFRVLMVYPNLAMMLLPPLSIGLFTRLLESQGYVTELFDTTQYVTEETTSQENRVKYLQYREFDAEGDLDFEIKTELLEDFRHKVLDFQPDLMLYSVVEDSFSQCVKLLETVSDLKIPHLLGGVFPTAAPEVCIEHPEINLIGLGEGEKTILHVAESVRTGRSLSGTPNCWHKDPDGNIFRNPQTTLVNINDLRANYHRFEMRRFYRPMGGRVFKTIPVETYRGCPYSCTYCNSPMQRGNAKNEGLGSFLRRKTMPVLRNELRELVATYNPEFFWFIDDSFLARPQKEIFEFCEMYKEFSIPFWFNTRPENCTPEVMQRIKAVGAYRISFGIECGNEEFRKKVLKRSVSNAKLLEHFKYIAESKIAFSINLIIGFPGETRELVMDTVELVRSVQGYDALTVSIFTPYHGTALRDVAVRNGWLDASEITKHTTSGSILKMPPPYLSPSEIDGLMRVIPLYCYFPKSDWPAIKRAEINDEEGNTILESFSKIYRSNFLKETQDADKIFVEGGTGCKTNPKDRFVVSPSRLTPIELEALVGHSI
jgi:anaerobic magnesium-protoporphyrin IX monomethyl ester cyclase